MLGQFLHSTDFDMIWIGRTLSFGMRNPAPFVRAGKLHTFQRIGDTTKDRNFLNPTTFGYQTGYAGHYQRYIRFYTHYLLL